MTKQKTFLEDQLINWLVSSITEKQIIFFEGGYQK